MPFSKTTDDHTKKYWTDHFEEFLKPQIKSAVPGIKVERSRVIRDDLLTGIIQNLFSADIVVADLTDHNPNVFWELGIRHSFKHGTVILAEKGTKFPFDISRLGIHEYSGESLSERKFDTDFSEAIIDCIKNKERPDSHVLEVLGGRGTLWYTFRKQEILLQLQ